jgi:GntR family transcriptional regulator
MEFQISTTSDAPIYRQLAVQIRRGVALGKLAVGVQLPSVRELSRQLVVNPNTIARAYTELERDGVVHTRQGIGVFIAQPRSDVNKAVRKRQLAEAMDETLTEAIYLGFSRTETCQLWDDRGQQFHWPEDGA